MIADMTITAPTATLPLTEGRWTLDTNHTSVGFTVRRLGLSKVRGRFGDVAAELVVGPTLAECGVTATVALASIESGNSERDAHLRAVDFLDVEQRTTMTFRSRRVRVNGAAWTVDGELTIGDVTGPLTLALELAGVTPAFDGKRHAAFDATGEIRRTDFGLGFGPYGAALGDFISIELDLEFIEPAAPEPVAPDAVPDPSVSR